MWGICLDVSLCEGKLSQRVIEYELSSDNNKAIIVQPFPNFEVDLKKIIVIADSPKYTYGAYVCPVNHPDRKGKIRDIIWHFKNRTFNYYIEVNNKKVSKRYYEEDLVYADSP
ncbi:MAG: hypothetical protein IJ861_00295 [Clostridia bacterium]|nr:hypothetical protein [Clostridia bacterium]